MLKETPENHPDRSVSQETFSKFQELADFVNTSLKESESRKKMNDLTKNITGLKNLESPNRSLIKEGAVSLNTPKKKYQVCFVLPVVSVRVGTDLSPLSIQSACCLMTCWYLLRAQRQRSTQLSWSFS